VILTTLLDTSDLGLTVMPDPNALELETIVQFSCQKGEKKEKIQTIDHRQQSNLLSVYTRHIMWKWARLRIQLDGGWLDLGTRKRYMRLLNGVGVAHSLRRKEYALTTFRFKNNKYIMKIIKCPLWSS
jgi:hypothetical protein